MYQGTALNADERDWLTEARREQQEAPIEEQPFGLAFLVSTLVAAARPMSWSTSRIACGQRRT